MCVCGGGLFQPDKNLNAAATAPGLGGTGGEGVVVWVGMAEGRKSMHAEMPRHSQQGAVMLLAVPSNSN